MRVRFDLGDRRGVSLQIRGMQVRDFTDQDLRREQEVRAKRHNKIRLAEIIRRAHQREWPARIESAIWTPNELRLKAKVSGATDATPLFAVPRFPHQVAASPPTSAELDRRIPLSTDGENSFAATIPVATESPLRRPGVRWQVIRLATDEIATGDESNSAEVLSAATYPEPVCLNSDIVAPKRLAAAKGLTCITSRLSPDQLRELGLQHASINLSLAGLISETAEPGYGPRVLLGKTWWIHEGRLRSLDRNVATAEEAGLQLAAIVLIPNRPETDSPLVHPEADPAGTYAMPDLTAPRPVAMYSAILDFLAERYSGGPAARGRVDHWIVHNEVDYGWQWTNMGHQPFEIFMDHYVRSMRLIDHAVRTHNPHARVFISLTHRWNTTDNRAWKTYPPRDMLDWLNRHSKIAGDFPWGVAYHPYPQSLWKADTWNDTQTTDDIDTPLITVKNLQVLDRFMHLPESRTADGDVRDVICSEQGFHAEASDPRQLETQAAALLYTWQQLRRCPSILAFDYHRPSDHPLEGGLMLGLRGLPDETDPVGKPKPAWDVYKNIGTPLEAADRRRLQHHWQ